MCKKHLHKLKSTAHTLQELSMSETVFEPVCKSCLCSFSEPALQAGENTKTVHAPVLPFTEEGGEAQRG